MVSRERLTYTQTDFKRIRQSLGVTQKEFAILMGMSLRSITEWELGNRRPHPSACYLYRVAEKYPKEFMNL